MRYWLVTLARHRMKKKAERWEAKLKKGLPVIMATSPFKRPRL